MSEGFPPGVAVPGPGSRVGGYRLEELIGRGGMAAVFRAHDERLGRTVALKVLAAALAADEEFRQRFIRESRAAARVDDPHIIPVFEAGEADGVLFIAMRYVGGGDVRSLVHRPGALPAQRVAAIVSPVASALDAAHAAGLVHRDIKPANMLLDSQPGRPDHVYLSDFGITREALGPAGLTGSGHFLGTAGYAAPEQIAGGAVDGRADQYALGCAAFEMVCGQLPFRREPAMAVLMAHLHEPPPAVSPLRSGLPAALDGVFARVLAKDPRHRYANCREFAAALRAALGVSPYGTGEPDLTGLRHDHPDTVRVNAPWAAAVPGPGYTAAAGRVGAPAGSAPAPAVPGREPGAPASGGKAVRWPLVAGVAAAVTAAAATAAAVAVFITRYPAAPAAGNRPVAAGSAGTSQPASTGRPASAAGTSRPAAAGGTAPAVPAAPASPVAADNTWIAQLASVPVSDGTGRLSAVLSKVRQQIPQAQVLDSAQYASLRPGFWVVYYAGSFANGTQALTYCAMHGRATRNQCIGRYLSSDPADRGYQCYPPASAAASSCYRP